MKRERSQQRIYSQQKKKNTLEYEVIIMERKLLKQRQREGIEIAKSQGKYKGRKPIPINWMKFGQLYGEWKSKKITARDFMRRMGLSANTFYRRVREYEERNEIILEPAS